MADLTGFGSLFDFLNGVVSRVWPDKTKQAELNARIQEAILAGELREHEQAWSNANKQVEVNLEEAKSPSLFVSGWRPFIGWTGGFAYAWTFVIQPNLTWLVLCFGSPETRAAIVTMPHLDMGPIGTLTMGILGLGAYRTFEKFKGVEHKR